MRKSEMKLLLEERFERIAMLESRIDTMDQLVEGYRVREQAVLNALQTGKDNAAKALEEAKAEGELIKAEAKAVLAESEQVRQNARGEAEALLSEAISAAKELQLKAERSAIEMTATVKADSERMLRDAEIIKREYEELVDSFNAMLEQNASELEITAARFAEFVKNRKIDTAETHLDGNAFYKSVGALNDTALPDASENPALLMQNIYRIQNRPMPEDAQSQQKEEVAGMEAKQGATAEPYSEAAWMNEAQRSESEPQAEFTKAFDNAFDGSDFNIRTNDCNVTQADAENAIDALLSGRDSGGSVTAEGIPKTSAFVDTDRNVQPESEAVQAFDDYFDETFATAKDTVQEELPPGQPDELPEPSQQAASVPKPFSEQAWAQSAVASALEPQAEGTLFGDVTTETAFPVQTVATIDKSSGDAEKAFDEYLARIISDTAATGAVSETSPMITSQKAASVPKPFSAQAWAQSTVASAHEPQVEGTLFGDVAAEMKFSTQTEATTEKPIGDVEKAFDEYLAQINSYAPIATGTAIETAPETNSQQTATMQEPFSEQAWARNAVASEFEPQAEGNLFSAAEPEYEPDPAPAPRRYNEYGEIREWEPEPDIEDMPTVSRFVGQSGNYDEVSLDDLLDEIIKSGE